MNDIFYGHYDKDNNCFRDIYARQIQTTICGSGTQHKLRIRMATDDEQSNYWGWHDTEDQELCMIFPSRMQVEICFTYGYEAAEKAGKGKLVNLVVEEIKGE